MKKVIASKLQKFFKNFWEKVFESFQVIHCNLAKFNLLLVVFKDFGDWELTTNFLYITNDGIKTLKRRYLKKRHLSYSFAS